MIDYERGYEQGKADAMKGAEPLGWIYIEPKWKHAYVDEVDLAQIPEVDEWYPIYFKPQRPWVGLTDEEIKEIIGPWGDTPIKGYTRKLFDQIENKLKEKNA